MIENKAGFASTAGSATGSSGADEQETAAMRATRAKAVSDRCFRMSERELVMLFVNKYMCH